jgi:peptidylprolyl isomerase
MPDVTARGVLTHAVSKAGLTRRAFCQLLGAAGAGAAGLVSVSAAVPASVALAARTDERFEVAQWPEAPPLTIDPEQAYAVTIKTSLGEMTAELYAKDAPNTVNNFLFLAGEGFYDGVIFHRIISGFMVQTGDPTGTGRGGPGYKFADELTGPQTYVKGTLAMANAGPNTQGSQFFICQGPGAERLPKKYTIFGKVTAGLDVLDAIASVPVKASVNGEMSSPVDPPVIGTIAQVEAAAPAESAPTP